MGMQVPVEARRGCQVPWSWELQVGVSPQCGCRELNLAKAEKVEQSLQPLLTD